MLSYTPSWILFKKHERNIYCTNLGHEICPCDIPSIPTALVYTSDSHRGLTNCSELQDITCIWKRSYVMQSEWKKLNLSKSQRILTILLDETTGNCRNWRIIPDVNKELLYKKGFFINAVEVLCRTNMLPNCQIQSSINTPFAVKSIIVESQLHVDESCGVRVLGKTSCTIYIR
jgi:hypothetical protein